MQPVETDIRQIIAERDQYKAMQFVPPGHFYSVIPDLNDIKQREQRLFAPPTKILPGINMREEEQVDMLKQFAQFYQEQPFSDNKESDKRYFFDNPAFAYADGLALYSMIRLMQPKRIIEVGSGYSSCVTLDTNDRFFDFNIKCTFMEPYPDLMLKLIEPDDLPKIELLPIGLQDVELDYFRSLEAGDICFIDSTHVGKIGSDVNYIFFHILPALKEGVIIHFHDIFYPFEYPKEWIYDGRAWNENYYLRAFLEFNESFDILYFNDYMRLFHHDKIINHMPLCMKNSGGSIWLKKVK